MANDLVGRLREAGTVIDGNESLHLSGDLLYEAADEIERLQERLRSTPGAVEAVDASGLVNSLEKSIEAARAQGFAEGIEAALDSVNMLDRVAENDDTRITELSTLTRCLQSIRTLSPAPAGKVDEVDGDSQTCEHCGKNFDIEKMTMMEDCWFCEGCYADWKKHFDACEHEWEPRGEGEKLCRKCSGVVRDEPQPTSPAPSATGRGQPAPDGVFDLRAFSRENLARCTSPSGFNHALESWTLSDWMTATLGELGEAANVLKKLNRVRDGIPGNSETPIDLRRAFADELADTFIYLDLLAQAAGVDLPSATRTKFDRTSAKIGYTAAPQPPASSSEKEIVDALEKARRTLEDVHHRINHQVHKIGIVSVDPENEDPGHEFEELVPDIEDALGNLKAVLSGILNSNAGVSTASPELLSVLEPFAKAADRADAFAGSSKKLGMGEPGDSASSGMGITFGQLRRAREVFLAGIPPASPLADTDWIRNAAAEISTYAEDELLEAESLCNPHIASIIAKHAPASPPSVEKKT